MHIVTLTTCHNRRDCTLSLFFRICMRNLPIGVTLAHVIVDDGSSDRNGEAVRALSRCRDRAGRRTALLVEAACVMDGRNRQAAGVRLSVRL